MKVSEADMRAYKMAKAAYAGDRALFDELGGQDWDGFPYAELRAMGAKA